jgi:glycosyltransferase involved in cell wall biosynthesis
VRSELDRIRSAGADRLRLLGPIPHAVNVMPAFDLYVTPTRLPGESFGMAPAEAMSQGVPVLTMEFGGTAEIIEHGVSGLALPLAASDWVHAISALAADPHRRARMGEAARQRIQRRFSSDAVAADCMLLFRSVVAGGDA